MLEEGSAYDQGQLDGFMAWLKYSGAQDIGIPVGNGRVVVNHTSEYATRSDGDCTDYLRAAERLIKSHKVSCFMTTAFQLSLLLLCRGLQNSLLVVKTQ